LISPKRRQKPSKLSKEKTESFEVAFLVVQVVDASDDVILEATEQCPALLANCTAIMAIAKNWWTEDLQETLQFSPIAIHAGKELVLEAVKSNPMPLNIVRTNCSWIERSL
jgi:hypothetical protein